MKIDEFVALTRALRGHMSEPTRAAMIHGICNMVRMSLTDDVVAWWKAKGRLDFLTDCCIEADPATTSDDLVVEPSKLSLFINKWRATVAYKTAEGAFEDLSPEMKALIVTMTEDLEDLAVEMPVELELEVDNTGVDAILEVDFSKLPKAEVIWPRELPVDCVSDMLKRNGTMVCPVCCGCGIGMSDKTCTHCNGTGELSR